MKQKEIRRYKRQKIEAFNSMDKEFFGNPSKETFLKNLERWEKFILTATL